MANDDLFILLTAADLSVGKPLPWHIYDNDKTLLLREGDVFDTQEQIDNAVNNGLYRRQSGILTKNDRELELDSRARLDDVSLRGKFEEMSAKVGDLLLLQVKAAYGDERCKVRLMGFVVGKTVITEAPRGVGNNVNVREEQAIIVRSFSGKLAYGFSTHAVKVCSTPLPYLHLAYPEFVHKVPVRESTRVTFSIIGTASKLEDETDTESFSVLIVDISTTGAAFMAPGSVADRDSALRIAFRVKIQDIEVMPAVECIVRSCAPVESGSNGKHRFGVQFRNLKTQDLLALQGMVYQKMLEQV